MGFVDWVINDFVGPLLGGFVNGAIELIIQLTLVLFGVSPLRTEGPWPFGEPLGPEVVGPQAGFNGGLLGALAKNVYPKVSIVNGGEIVVFSLLLFVILFPLSGYMQTFDPFLSNPDPTERSDPLIGFLLIIYWFPLYFGFLSLVHEVYIIITPDAQTVTVVILSTLNSAALSALTGIGTSFLGIALLLLIALAGVLMIRAILAAALLLFGPVFIAIGWSDIPYASESARDILRYSLGIAVAPLPLPVFLWILGLFLDPSQSIPLLFPEWVSQLIAPISAVAQNIFGIVIFDALIAASLIYTWKLFKKSGGYMDKIGGAAVRVGAASGIYYRTSDMNEASRALKYGPGAAASRAAFQGMDSNDGDGDGNGQGQDVDHWERLKQLRGKLWDRDGRRNN